MQEVERGNTTGVITYRWIRTCAIPKTKRRTREMVIEFETTQEARSFCHSGKGEGLWEVQKVNTEVGSVPRKWVLSLSWVGILDMKDAELQPNTALPRLVTGESSEPSLVFYNLKGPRGSVLARYN